MDFPLLIFTDLDGTLLDHHSYSYDGARKALQRLRRLSVPLVLTSSKTRAEIQQLQKMLKLNEPFIAENGGGLFIPYSYKILNTGTLENQGDYYVKQFGRPYKIIRKIFESVKIKYHLKGFGDMSPEEIMGATGLARKDALLAAKRDFTEPFIFLEKPLVKELTEEIADHGLKITRGGRFYHLIDAGQDKGKAVAETRQLFQTVSPDIIISVGLGDADNDFSMLRTVDIPVLLPKPDGSFADLDLENLRKPPYPGSRGWGSAITAVLDEFNM